MKVVYIAHPIGGDVEGNLQRVAKICRDINLNEEDAIPFAPYYSDCIALDDSIKKERERGIKNSVSLFHTGIIDELRLYGDRLSSGMRVEVDLAIVQGIRIIPMTEYTAKELNRYLKHNEAKFPKP